jgi:tetratricopeptide (TPR) repeat protein
VVRSPDAGARAAVRPARSRAARGACVGLGLCLLALPSRLIVQASRPPEKPVGDLLDAYSRGDAAGVVNNLASRRDSVSAFAHALQSTAPAWLALGGAADLPRRRLVAAAVALEAARALTPHPNPSQMTEFQWPDRVRLLEWGCALIRQTNPAPPAERWWHLASVGLLEQSYGFPFYAYQDAWSDGQRHLSHATARFPGEPRFALASAVIAEENAGLIGYALDDLPNAPLARSRYDVRIQEGPSGAADVVMNPLPGTGSPAGGRAAPSGRSGLAAPDGRKTVPFPTDHRNFRYALREAVRGYSALTTRDGIAAEAHLHLGAIEVYLGQPELALPHLDAAAQGASDPLLQYTAQFFRGAALTRLGQVQAAEVAFRSALGAIPHAESATIGLAWLLVLNEHRADASALTDAELASSAMTADPLASYALGDARLWPVFIGELRAAVARRPGT